jgi:hypothetical protein
MTWLQQIFHILRTRGFKSHLAWDDVPKGARYIVATTTTCWTTPCWR